MTPASQYQSEKAPVDASVESRLVIVCRAAVFMLLMLCIVLGPSYKQVFKGKSKVLGAWRMYYGRGFGVCDVEFYIRHPDGRIEYIDHFKALGYDKLLKLHHHSRRIRREKGVLEVGQRMRQKVGDDVDLRVNARIGTRDGWETLYADKRIE